MPLLVLMAWLGAGMRLRALEAADADNAFNSFNNAYYVSYGNGMAYYKETTAGGRAWFWTQANMIEMVADAYDRTGSTGQRDMLSALCNGFMDFHGQDWSWNEYNDDVLWACMVFTKAYKITGNTTFRDRAIANFNMTWNRGWSNDLGGGMWWRTDNQSKNACDNCPAAIAACQLYEITRDVTYLTKAKQAVAWVKANLVAENGAVYDNMNRAGNVTTWTFSYNSGTYAGACNFLYRLTGDPTYLADALKAVRYVRSSICDANGIFPNNGDGDGAGFNGVGIRWICQFVRDQSLWQEFYPWLKANADRAWSMRRGDNLSWNNWNSVTAAGTRYAFECFGTVTTLQAVPLTNPATSTVFTNVAEVTGEKYQVVYSLDLPVNAAWQGATAIPYTVNRGGRAGGYDRVAYYLELTKTDGTTQWVYVSMDAFSTDGTKIGLPHNVSNPVVFQQPVKNLTVLSNVAAVTGGTFMEGGNIEMWPSNYDPGNAAGIFAASSAVYDWGDQGGTTAAGFGCFQIHNALLKQTVLAYNHWGEDGGVNDDVGIGSQTGGSSDWTFATNAGNYVSRKLTVLVRPNTPRVALAEFPQQSALYPRNVATNKAAVPVTGSVAAAGYSKATLRVYRDGNLISTLDQALSYPASGGNAPFSFAPEIVAEPVNYTFELSITANNVETLIRRARNVVAGDVLLFYGQSNSEAGRAFTVNNQSSAAYASPFVRTYGQNTDSGNGTRNNLSWVTADGDGAGSTYADPGAVGQWAIVIGRKILDDYRIPVAILNGGRQGYTMAQLKKDDANPAALDDAANPRPYNRLRYRANQAGVAAKARALFYYQGESEYDNAATYASGFADLWADWQTDYPALEHVYQVQVRPGCGVSTGSMALRQMQRSLADSYAHVSVMTGNGLSAHDGCHYNFTNGYEKLGLFHYRQVARDLYGAPAQPDIDALNPSKVEFTDASRRGIRVTMRDAGATIDLPPAALEDFFLTGAPGEITGCSVEGSSIVFTLDRPAVGAPVLEYRGHPGAGEWVTNGSGVGMLAFSEPVQTGGPVVKLLAPAGSLETAVNAPLTVSATSAPGAHGSAIRTMLAVNGVTVSDFYGANLNAVWQPSTPGAYELTVTAYDASGFSGMASFSLVAGPAAPPVSSGLKVWLTAGRGVVRDSMGAVSQWQDQSGSGNHLSQGVALAQPHFVEGSFVTGPGIAFDGGDYLSAAGGMPTGSYTKVVRFKAASAAYSNNLLSSSQQNDATGDHALWAPGLKPAIYHSQTVVGSSAVLKADADTLLVATYDAASNNARLYVNGSLQASGTMPLDNSVSSFQLGAFAGGSNLYGEIGEVMVFDHVLTEAERATLGGYFNDRYKTPLELWQRDALAGAPMSEGSDSDGDGFSDLFEYAFGMNPLAADVQGPAGPKVESMEGYVVVSFGKRLDRPDLQMQLESSIDLIHWTAVSDSYAGIDGALELREYGEDLPAGKGATFYRLSVKTP